MEENIMPICAKFNCLFQPPHRCHADLSLFYRKLFLSFLSFSSPPRKRWLTNMDRHKNNNLSGMVNVLSCHVVVYHFMSFPRHEISHFFCLLWENLREFALKYIFRALIDLSIQYQQFYNMPKGFCQLWTKEAKKFQRTKKV